MTPEQESQLDWSICTWKGSRRHQHEQFHALSLRRKLELIEEMCDHARATVAWRQAQGLPYFDPETGELVKGSSSAE